MSDEDKAEYYTSVAVAERIAQAAASSVNIPVDSALSNTSENPVQNKVINSALSGKQDVANIVNPGYYGPAGSLALPPLTEEEQETKYPSVAASKQMVTDMTTSTALCGSDPGNNCDNGTCYWLCLPGREGWEWHKVFITTEHCPETHFWNGSECTPGV